MRQIQFINSQDQNSCLEGCCTEADKCTQLVQQSTTLILLYYLCMLAPHELRAVTTVSTNNSKKQMHSTHAHNGAVFI